MVEMFRKTVCFKGSFGLHILVLHELNQGLYEFSRSHKGCAEANRKGLNGDLKSFAPNRARSVFLLSALLWLCILEAQMTAQAFGKFGV